MDEQQVNAVEIRPVNMIIANFLRYTADALTLVSLTHHGARSHLHYRNLSQKIVDLMVSADADPLDKDYERLAKAEESVAMAQKEIDRGFPILHNHFLMGLWGALEAVVDDLCLSYAMSHPEVLQSELFRKVKVPAADLLALPRSGQVAMVLEEAQRSPSSSRSIGISQFESQLGLVGLNGEVDRNLRDVMRIVKALRNLVAHRGGVVDRRFLEICPDLGVREKETIKITERQLHAGAQAMAAYAIIVSNRAGATNGRPLKTSDLESPDSTANYLSAFKSGGS